MNSLNIYDIIDVILSIEKICTTNDIINNDVIKKYDPTIFDKFIQLKAYLLDAKLLHENNVGKEQRLHISLTIKSRTLLLTLRTLFSNLEKMPQELLSNIFLQVVLR